MICRLGVALVTLSVVVSWSGRAGGGVDPQPAWAEAHRQPPMTAEEASLFMKDLARFVFDNHLKQKADSPQRGMLYEYLDVRHKGQVDQFVEGEALDTMHDGAWFAAAMVNAYRATGDDFYKKFLTEWQLPFYLKMLNHSDKLFIAGRNDAKPGSHTFGREHALQAGEKGFVPYFWDDGGSVSLERRLKKTPLAEYACVDLLVGQPNPNFLLNGYSLGSSNHMAQDLGVMIELAWLLLRDSNEAADRRLATEVVDGAKNLHACRVRHGSWIPMCVAPAALAAADADLMKRVPAADDPKYWAPKSHYVRAMAEFQPGQPVMTPGFADDQQYRYYFGIAKAAGRVPEPLAFKTIYDAYTEPLLYQAYCDDAPVPAGVNRFDLHPFGFRDGKPTDYRSDRKGPFRRPRPIGSRMGPQNMICCGWALQLLHQYPGLWEKRYQREFAKDLRVYVVDPASRGKAAAAVPLAIKTADATVSVESSRSELNLSGSFSSDALEIKIFGLPDAKDLRATITLKKDQALAANDRGERLVQKAKMLSNSGSTAFTVRIPYTFAKGQTAWLNAIEHGRYSIAVGDCVRNLYLASSEEDVQAWLEHELGGGLRTWAAIFCEKGYIPTGLGAGFWDDFSDTGGYAHLISAAAQWRFYLAGKRDWETHQVPKVP